MIINDIDNKIIWAINTIFELFNCIFKNKVISVRSGEFLSLQTAEAKCWVGFCKVFSQFLYLIKKENISKLNKVVPSQYFDSIPFAPWVATHYPSPSAHLPLQSRPSVLPLWEKPVPAHPPDWAIDTVAFPVLCRYRSLLLLPRLCLREESHDLCLNQIRSIS